MKTSPEPIDILDGLQCFLTSHSLVRKGDRVLLAVSGGIDSMVMLDLFERIRHEWNLTLSVAHVNHQLRGEEADKDEEFVRAVASEKGLHFRGMRVDVTGYQSAHKVSKQEAARILRYESFEQARAETGAGVVATAHHADDNAETVLMNALRGAGVRGLTGIPIRREPGSVIRPLLFAYRKELEAYANDRGIEYREDASNASRAYTRNHLRHEVLPSLSQNLQTDVTRSLNRVSSLMRSLGEILSAETVKLASLAISAEAHKGETAVSIEVLTGQPLFMQDELILHVLRTLAIEPTTQKVQACLALCNLPTGRSLDLSGEWSVLHDRKHLRFRRNVMPVNFEQEIQIGHEYDFAGFRFSVRPLEKVPKSFDHPPDTEFADADRLGRHLVVRSWKEGDWFIPLGMSGRKKLSDFFVNSKVSRTDKHTTPILESDGAIVWVCGFRLDERFSITASTRRAVELTYQRLRAQ